MDYSLIIYIIFSSISILLGMLFFQNKEKSILFFVFLSLILPTSPQFMFATSYQGVYFYDYYFLLLTIYYLVNLDFKKICEISDGTKKYHTSFNKRKKKLDEEIDKGIDKIIKDV